MAKYSAFDIFYTIIQVEYECEDECEDDDTYGNIDIDVIKDTREYVINHDMLHIMTRYNPIPFKTVFDELGIKYKIVQCVSIINGYNSGDSLMSVFWLLPKSREHSLSMLTALRMNAPHVGALCGVGKLSSTTSNFLNSIVNVVVCNTLVQHLLYQTGDIVHYDTMTYVRFKNAMRTISIRMLQYKYKELLRLNAFRGYTGNIKFECLFSTRTSSNKNKNKNTGKSSKVSILMFHGSNATNIASGPVSYEEYKEIVTKMLPTKNEFLQLIEKDTSRATPEKDKPDKHITTKSVRHKNKSINRKRKYDV